MKILSAQQIRDCDVYTITNEPITSIDLMERASGAFVEAFLASVSSENKQVTIFCGTGNNGGDGLVVARLLHEEGWKVDCYLVAFSKKVSPDNQSNQKRLSEVGVTLHSINTAADFPENISPIVIDALVGTGITRPLEGLLGDVVQKINQQKATVFSVDLPSGLYDQDDCTQNIDCIIHATYSFTFQNPKLNFLLPEYSEVVGEWSVLDIGLDQSYINELPCDAFLVDDQHIKSLLLVRKKHSHKGTYGHAGLICGSKGMMGAAVLATSSCLRSGAGLTTVMVPEVGYSILQTTCPEAMCLVVGTTHWRNVPVLQNYTCVGVGPGLGQHGETKEALLLTLESSEQTVVLDADALNLLQESDLSLLPANSIITPHPKEFERLFGKTSTSHRRLELAQKKAKEYKIIILLKGHHSCIALPNGNLCFNNTGNAGMAKGGSGDVLTGLITGLVARGYAPENAAIIGCYLHGLAGDICSDEIGMEGMTARDLVQRMPQAWSLLIN
ncbi:MAG: NAD(P)H-hydrate dehydratase [bacterium]|nr:NAD(P)H-hydrate dehydratase [bacterium]